MSQEASFLFASNSGVGSMDVTRFYSDYTCCCNTQRSAICWNVIGDVLLMQDRDFGTWYRASIQHQAAYTQWRRKVAKVVNEVIVGD